MATAGVVRKTHWSIKHWTGQRKEREFIVCALGQINFNFDKDWRLNLAFLFILFKTVYVWLWVKVCTLLSGCRYVEVLAITFTAKWLLRCLNTDKQMQSLFIRLGCSTVNWVNFAGDYFIFKSLCCLCNLCKLLMYTNTVLIGASANAVFCIF